MVAAKSLHSRPQSQWHWSVQLLPSKEVLPSQGEEEEDQLPGRGVIREKNHNKFIPVHVGQFSPKT
jgi:hypothetical protein